MTASSERLTMSVSNAALLACVAAFATGVAAGDRTAQAAPPAYVGAGSFSLPTGSSAFSDGADGRLVCITETGAIVRQSSVNGGAYAPLGSLPAGAVPSFGAGFLRLSQSGAMLAIGDNGAANRVHFVPLAGLTTIGPTTPQSVAAPNFDGAWATETTFYVGGSASSGTPPLVSRIALSSITTSTTVITNVGDGSGGVAVRGAQLYAAIGYDAAGPLTGQVRSFDLATLNSATAPVLFSSGVLATQANTSNSVDFDNAGNIIVAGFGGVAVVDLVANQRYELPGLSSTGFYAANYNDFTHEILVRDFGSQTVLRYAVPAPVTATLLGMSGILAGRRRRYA